MSATSRYTPREIYSVLQSALDGLFESSADSERETWLRMPHKDAREALVELDGTILVACFLIEEAAQSSTPLNPEARRTLRKCAGAIGRLRDRVQAAKVPQERANAR